MGCAEATAGSRHASRVSGLLAPAAPVPAGCRRRRRTVRLGKRNGDRAPLTFTMVILRRGMLRLSPVLPAKWHRRGALGIGEPAVFTRVLTGRSVEGEHLLLDPLKLRTDRRAAITAETSFMTPRTQGARKEPEGAYRRPSGTETLPWREAYIGRTTTEAGLAVPSLIAVRQTLHPGLDDTSPPFRVIENDRALPLLRSCCNMAGENRRARRRVRRGSPGLVEGVAVGRIRCSKLRFRCAAGPRNGPVPDHWDSAEDGRYAGTRSVRRQATAPASTPRRSTVVWLPPSAIGLPVQEHRGRPSP